MKKVGIIGAGASGLSAACTLSDKGVPVILFDKKEQAGKKLSITGNGHGNFTNSYLTASCYHADTLFMKHFLDRFSYDDCIDMFRNLGMLSFQKDGYTYPSSYQAPTLTAVLTEHLKDKDVTWKLNTRVTGIDIKDKGFLIHTETEDVCTDILMICTGSPSGVRDRHSFNAYQIMESMGIRLTETCPSLVNLKGNEGFEDIWAGVRMKASVGFGTENETGEIQFRNDGISGIPVFQLSASVIRSVNKGEKPEIILDLLPDYKEEELVFLLKRETGASSAENYLRGWLPKKMIPVVLKRSRLFGKKKIREFSDTECDAIVRQIKHFSYRISGYGDYTDSQVTSGGVDINEITDYFESRKYPGLFITGEMLDVDGKCGGYNLHFAFGSGKIAGEYISEIYK